jgi:hypothetical protein
MDYQSYDVRNGIIWFDDGGKTRGVDGYFNTYTKRHGVIRVETEHGQGEGWTPEEALQDAEEGNHV